MSFCCSYGCTVDTSQAPQRVDTTHKFFVRHNRDFLYWGSHTGTSNSHNHHEWVVHGIALNDNGHFDTPCASTGRTSPKLQLRNFPGSQIGTEVDFCIHHENFYAVSNCLFELVEIDWTSFYHCISFPLDQPVEGALRKKDRIYRRMHDDGVIQDGWINLSLQVDEATDELMIVEARDEFRNDYQPNAPRHSRTWYTTKVDFENDDGPAALGPENDPFYPLREPKSNYAPRKTPLLIHTHSENLHSQFNSTLARLKHTKYMTYNLNTHSFLDVILKLDCPFDGGCVQLRTGRRWLKSNSSPGNVLADPAVYCYNNVQTWPPPAWESEYSQTAHSIVTLADVYDGHVAGWPMRIMGDDRFLLILLHGDNRQGTDKLLLLSFDKFAPIPALNSLGRENRPANVRVDYRSKTDVHPPSKPMEATFSSAGDGEDDEEIPDAEDLDIDEIMDEAWP